MFETLFKYPLELYHKGEVGFSLRMPVEVRLLLMLAAAGLVYLLYRKTRAGIPPLRRGILIALRAMTLIVLLLMIFGPTLRIPKLKSEETFVALMVDATKSMTIDD